MAVATYSVTFDPAISGAMKSRPERVQQAKRCDAPGGEVGHGATHADQDRVAVGIEESGAGHALGDGAHRLDDDADEQRATGLAHAPAEPAVELGADDGVVVRLFFLEIVGPYEHEPNERYDR